MGCQWSPFLSQDAVGQDYAEIFSWDDPNVRRQTGRSLCQKLDEILAGFHKQVDAEGVCADAPAKKKQRKGRRKVSSGSAQAPVDVGPEEAEIKIGTQKQQAIKNILLRSTPESYRMMCRHLSNFVRGGEKRSAVTPEVLAWKHLWPMSSPPEGQSPSEAEEIARRTAAGVTRRLLPDRVTLLDFACPDAALIGCCLS